MALSTFYFNAETEKKQKTYFQFSSIKFSQVSLEMYKSSKSSEFLAALLVR